MAMRLDGGSFDTLRAFASAGFADARGDAYLAIAGDTSAGDRVHARRRAIRFNANIGIRLSDDVETRLYASAQSLEQELPGALTYGVATYRPQTGSFAGDQQRNVNSFRLQNRTRFTFGNGGLDVGVFLNAKQLFHPIYQVVDQKSLDWGSYARLDQDFGAFGLHGGVTARFGTVDSKRYVNLDGQRGAATFRADLAARTIDAYAEGRIRPLPGLTLIAGAIYTSGLRRQDQLFPATIAGRATFDQLSPKLGLLYEPANDLQLYANLSRSHELPGFIELAQIAAFVPLDAQRAWTAEFGARGRVGPVRFDVTAYRANLEGELLQFNVNPPTIPAATFNASRTRHQGIEAGVDVALASWVRVRQTYQWSDFRFRSDAQFGDNRLPVVPEHVLRSEVRIGTENLRVTPNLEWVPRGAFADYANSFRPRGYALIGLGAQARIGERFTLFADARNLADRKAAGDVSAVIAYAPANAIFYPVERRSVFAGVRAAF
ncbi:MAG: TonB-dependent receptor [Sphingomonadales bacterium]|nr:MAG: TonB-dependent receptor [Sphingomonadales bacterium]